MRPLTLHASALTDPEYSLYTTALLDLAGEDTFSHPHDDSYYAALVVSARETRAWVRGRYTELLPAQVDAVLKLFCPNIAPADTLSGGQFFAALRLVTHIRHGNPLDGGLVFVQAHPDDATSPPLQTSSTPIPLKASGDSLAHSRNTSGEGHLIDDSVPSTPPALPPKPLLSPTPSSSTNPFINRTKSHDPPTLSTSTPTLPPALRVKSTPALPAPPQQPVIPPLPPRKSMSVLVEERGKPPPPPPPRHSMLTPSNSSPFAFWHNQSSGTNVLIQQSLQAGRIAQSLKEAEKKLEKERVLEVLKSSAPSTSRDPSKRTRSESPGRGVAAALAISAPSPTTAVARSYSVSSGSGSNSSVSAEQQPKQTKGPALPPRRRVSPPNSAWSGRSGRFTDGGRSVVSTNSLREVATASVGSTRRTSSSRERRAAASPPPVHPDLVPQPSPVLPVLPALLAGEKGPPPTHPGRKPPPIPNAPASATSAVFFDGPDQDFPSSPGAGGRGVFRSRSMHHHPVSPNVGGGGGVLPPVPPPRPRPRRRPDSVQFSPTIASVTNGLGSPHRQRAPSPTLTERTDRSARSVNTVLSSPASLPARGGGGDGGVGGSRHLSISQQQQQQGSGTPRPRRADSLSGNGGGGALKDGLRDRWESLQPRLDKARWKAEAGLSRRGYVAHRGDSAWRDREGEARLVDTDDGEEDEDDEDEGFGQHRRGTVAYGEETGPGHDAPSVDRDYRASDDDDGRARSMGGAERARRPWEVERDEMKWPVAPGEGWTPL